LLFIVWLLRVDNRNIVPENPGLDKRKKGLDSGGSICYNGIIIRKGS
jgi:hypothetical protein